MSSPARDKSGADWDSFWDSKVIDDTSLVQGGKAETWYDLVWKMGFESWYDIFQRLGSGSRMLEYGCGSAKISQYMGYRGYQCTMLDYSIIGLDLARSAFRSLGLEGCFVIGDINQMGLAGGQFDIVFSGGVLEFFTDVQQPICEAVRVLKPGGLFAITIVPNKFSIQTLADVERTFVQSVKNMAVRRWRQAFRRVQSVEPSVSTASLQEYVDCLQAAGLTSITARCTSPFPSLSLGKWGNKLYMNLMRQSLGFWQRFNESPSHWTEFWGITYTIYGFKGMDK